MTGAIEEGEFAALMARLGPFEPRPEIAVAVSGGADSMALALLAHRWALARGGRAHALTVDHRLRPESGDEAAQVGVWMAALGIGHHCLVREGARPAGDLQAAARAARHALLEGWCRAGGVLHLLLAHHREDQAETLLLRLARGSGVDGLAAMAPIAERPFVRLLRPLLGVPRARLAATLERDGQPWIDDPSNADRAYARVRLRGLLPELAAEGMSAARLAATARRMGRARAALEAMVSALLAACAAPHPAGFVRLDPMPLCAAPPEIGLRALSRVLACAGGAEHGPRMERLERLWQALRDGLDRPRSLAGCLLLPQRDALLVCREPRAVAEPVAAQPGGEVVWDGRFRATFAGRPDPAARLGALGAEGFRAVAAAQPAIARPAFPARLRATLPALWDERGVSAVPHLRYNRSEEGVTIARLLFCPRRPLTSEAAYLV